MTHTVRSLRDDASAPRRPTARRALAGLVVLALIVFWAWAFSPWAPHRKADALSDRGMVPAANAHCRAAKAELATFPPAQDAKTAAERADIVEQSNRTVARLVEQLHADGAAAAGRDRELIDQWLADWDTYLASRQRYVQDLRADAGARFTVPARDGGQITETMDGFSRTNRIMDCLVPLDV
jgi:hypothetical protein